MNLARLCQSRELYPLIFYFTDFWYKIQLYSVLYKYYLIILIPHSVICTNTRTNINLPKGESLYKTPESSSNYRPFDVGVHCSSQSSVLSTEALQDPVAI